MATLDDFLAADPTKKKAPQQDAVAQFLAEDPKKKEVPPPIVEPPKPTPEENHKVDPNSMWDAIVDRAHTSAEAMEAWAVEATKKAIEGGAEFYKTFGPLPGILPPPGLYKQVKEGKTLGEAYKEVGKTAAQVGVGTVKAGVTFPASVLGGVAKSITDIPEQGVSGLKPTEIRKDVEEVSQKIERATSIGEPTESAEKIMGGIGVPFEALPKALGTIGGFVGGEEGEAAGELVGQTALILGPLKDIAKTPGVIKRGVKIGKQIAKEAKAMKAETVKAPEAVVPEEAAKAAGPKKLESLQPDKIMDAADVVADAAKDLQEGRISPEQFKAVEESAYSRKSGEAKSGESVSYSKDARYYKKATGQYEYIPDEQLAPLLAEDLKSLKEIRRKQNEPSFKRKGEEKPTEAKEEVAPEPTPEPTPKPEEVISDAVVADASKLDAALDAITSEDQAFIQKSLAEKPEGVGGDNVLVRLGIKQKPNKLTLQERVALGVKLKAEERSAREAYRAGVQAVRAGRRALSEFVTKHLPYSERGRYIKSMAKATTQKQLDAIAELAKAHAVRVQKRNIRKGFIKMVRQLRKDSNVPVDVATRSVKDIIDMGLLKAETFARMSVKEAAALYESIQHRIDMGKLSLAEQRAQYAAKKQMIHDTIISEASNPVNAPPTLMGARSLDTMSQIMIRKGLAVAQNLNLAKMPIDALFDYLESGGRGTYDGPLSRLKHVIDRQWGLASVYADKWRQPLNEVAKKHKRMTPAEERDFVIKRTALQEGGLEKLRENGISPEEVAKIQFNPKQQAYSQAWDTFVAEVQPLLVDYFRRVENREFNVVKDYFPWITDWEAYSGLEMWQRFGDRADYAGRTKTVEQGFSKKRTGGAQKLNFDATQIMENHIKNTSYLLNVGETVKMLGEVFGTRDPQRAAELKSALGDKGTMVALDWVDTVARDGGIGSGHTIHVLDALRNNMGAATLGIRLSSALIQLSSLPDSGAIIGPYAVKGLARVLDPAWRRMVEEMPEIKHRIADDPNFMTSGKFKSAKDGAFWLLKSMDKLVAEATASGAYEKYCVEHGIEVDPTRPNLAAMEYAQLAVRRAQASMLPKDMPQAISRGAMTGNRSLDRALLQFQNFVLNRWSIIENDVYRAGIKHGNKFEAAAKFSWLILGTMAATGIRDSYQGVMNTLSGKEDKRKQSYPRRLAEEFVQTIPVVGQVYGAATYGSAPVPILQIVDDLRKGRLAQGAAELLGIPGSSFIASEARRFSKGKQDKEKAFTKEMKDFIQQSPKKQKWYGVTPQGERVRLSEEE